MNIDSTYLDALSGVSATARTDSSTGSSADGNFAALVEQARSKAEKAEADNAAAISAFHDYMKKTPEQRMREAILRDLGLTEEDLKNMSPEERQKVEDKIAQRIKDMLATKEQEKADKLAEKIQRQRQLVGSNTSEA